jgi:hypothetical protein
MDAGKPAATAQLRAIEAIMADHFISFSAPMIRALLDGRKTQTRRALKPQPNRLNGGLPLNDGHGSYSTDEGWKRYRISAGDRLWVKEAWRTFVSLDNLKPSEVWSKDQDRGAGIVYPAGGGLAITKAGHEYLYDEEDRDDLAPFGKVRNARFMPKWASRLTLMVTDVRVQRLHDINYRDAIAEGLIKENVIVDCHGSTGHHIEVTADRFWNGTEDDDFEGHEEPVDAYAALWDHINGAGSWDLNPWVTAYTFSVVKENIERIAA